MPDMSKVKDKALSVDEKSNLRLNQLEIKKNAIDIAAKEESTDLINNV